MFAASIGRGAGCSEEVLDDLRLGVSEACTEAILAAGNGDVVDLSMTAGRDRLHVLVRGPGSEAPQRVDGVDLLPALFPDATVGHEPGGRRAVAFSVPLA